MQSPLTSSDPLDPAVALIRQERFEEAVAFLGRLLKKDRRNAKIHFYLGVAESHAGMLEPARAHFREAIKLAPTVADYHQELGVVCQLMGRLEEAIRAYDEALKLAPGAPHVLASKAATYRLQGRYEEAVELLEPVVDGVGDDRRFALVFAGLAHRMGREQQAIDMLRRIEANSLAAPRGRASIAFAMAALRDRMGDYDGAFEDFTRANALYRVEYDAKSFEKRVDEFIAQWTIERFLALPRAVSTRESQRELPVFIVGMPRSGTSLTEQIIASHPEAYGAGELDILAGIVREIEGAPYGFVPLTRLDYLTQANVERMARRYLTAVTRMDRRAKRITDKMPQNFIHLGTIALLFPHAHIVHTIRDPQDTCISCFFQEFSPRLTFSFDIEACGHYHTQYQRLMAHWAMLFDAARGAGLPTPEIIDVVYEDLTEQQERETRRILGAVGLPWDDACLTFHRTERLTITASTEQVRRPMYRSSVKRHRHYEAHLGPLRRALGLDEDGV